MKREPQQAPHLLATHIIKRHIARFMHEPLSKRVSDNVQVCQSACVSDLTRACQSCFVRTVSDAFLSRTRYVLNRAPVICHTKSLSGHESSQEQHLVQYYSCVLCSGQRRGRTPCQMRESYLEPRLMQFSLYTESITGFNYHKQPLFWTLLGILRVF